MKIMWDGFISQLFSAWGKDRSMREIYYLPKSSLEMTYIIEIGDLAAQLRDTFVVWGDWVI